MEINRRQERYSDKLRITLYGAGALVFFLNSGIGRSVNQTGHSLLRGTASH